MTNDAISNRVIDFIDFFYMESGRIKYNIEMTKLMYLNTLTLNDPNALMIARFAEDAKRSSDPKIKSIGLELRDLYYKLHKIPFDIDEIERKLIKGAMNTGGFRYNLIFADHYPLRTIYKMIDSIRLRVRLINDTIESIKDLDTIFENLYLMDEDIRRFSANYANITLYNIIEEHDKILSCILGTKELIDKFFHIYN
jgi:hypothetical protein